MMLVLAMLSTSFMLAGTANAFTTISGCVKQLNKCNSNCDKYTAGPFQTSCYNRCASQHKTCIDSALPARTDTGPDPLHPKGTGGHTPPAGGTKDEPKAPPKVNDTRPPMGGGVFHPKQSDTGTSGPILHSGGSQGPVLHSGGTPGPILKSNSGNNGPSFRSGGRN
jgi:hypothetical protein